jgi:tRNA threonylcarbamoyl adenosine modification protein YeaZ
MSVPLRILALDTSGSVGSVALRLSAGSTREIRLPRGGERSESLGTATSRLLMSVGVRPADLDAVVVGLGPGSYTGTRIAVTFAKTLAFALRRPLYGISGLIAIAEDARGSGAHVAVLEPGHLGRVYAGIFDLANPIPSERLPVGLYAVDQVLAALPAGAVMVGSECPGFSRPRRVTSSALARLGDRLLTRNVPPADLESLEPLYLQASAPERVAGS